MMPSFGVRQALESNPHFDIYYQGNLVELASQSVSLLTCKRGTVTLTSQSSSEN